MIPNRIKKSLQIAGVLLPTLAIGLFSAPHLVRADVQTDMTSALSELDAAKATLQKGYHDKGGHRVNAIKLINQAEQEVRAGMDFDNSHHGKMENTK